MTENKRIIASYQEQMDSLSLITNLDPPQSKGRGNQAIRRNHQATGEYTGYICTH